MNMINKILFITDDCETEKEYSLKCRNSEGNKLAAKEEMVEALKEITDQVYVTYSLKEANRIIMENPDIFVVTTFYGIAEADSKSIIPALCKANSVKYLGADAYTQMICNDKNLSKKYINLFNLNSIPGTIIYNPYNDLEISKIKELEYPLIVKPNFGGGSNGIMDCSVTYNYQDTINLVRKLYNYQHMPIIVEKYISGYEISYIVMGNQNNIDFCGESMLKIDNKTMFDNEVFGLESKKINPIRKTYVPSEFVQKETQEKMIQLFKSFNKCEFMRIDCRVDKEGKIYIMELSPDCYIGTKGAFYETVKRTGITFNEMIHKLIENVK